MMMFQVFQSASTVELGHIKNSIGDPDHTHHKKSQSFDSRVRFTSTAIYYLLQGKSISCLHKLKSQELWFLGEHTSNVRIVQVLEDSSGKLKVTENILSKENPFILVNPHNWFGAELVNDESDHKFALMYLMVTPGFDVEVSFFLFLLDSLCTLNAIIHALQDWKIAKSLEEVVGDPKKLDNESINVLSRLLLKKKSFL